VHALIGLGNPGNRYVDTRHNIGFRVVDHFSAVKKIPFKSGKGDYYYKELDIRNQLVMIFKPTTYMNESGRAARQICEHFSIPVDRLLVICDDFNLPFGEFRFRTKGSDGGHNGLRSIIYQLETENFDRFRFGIGDQFTDAVEFVLNKFSKREMKQLNELLPISTEAIHLGLEKGIEQTMNQYTRQYINGNG
jgi:PTH1 family peptidyl-tRNA hydrolase